MAKSSVKVVIAALIGNLLITITKFIAAASSGSSRIEDHIRLRETRPLRTENRDYLPAKRSVFNMIVPEPTGGGFELKFARFLDDAPT